MAGRSLKANTAGIEQAETALVGKKWSQEDLAKEVEVDRQTVQKFFKGIQIDRKNFVAICEKLDLEWQVVIGEKSPEQISIDVLVEQARQRAQADIEQRCSWMRVLDMTQPIGLAAIYTEVNILEKITGKTRRDLDKLMQGYTPETFDRFLLGQVREQRVNGLEAVQNRRQLMILGRPGAGKTTFLKRLATLCNRGEFLLGQVPVFVSLKEFAETSNQPSLLNFIAHYFAPELSITAVQSILQQGRGLVLLDGLDEVLEQDHDRVLWEMRKFTRCYGQSHTVVTCRIAAREYLFEQFTEVEVADFSDEQIQDFAGKWFKTKEPDKVDVEGTSTTAQLFWKALEERKPVKELATNPLLLTLLCLEFEESSEFPQSRAELYERGLNILLTKWDGQRRIKRNDVYGRLSVKRKESLLGYLAMQTFDRGEYFFKQHIAERAIGQYIQNLPDASTDPEVLLVNSQTVLKSIESQHGLLTERATGIYSFSHLTFHEYFTARSILDTTEPTPQAVALKQLVTHVAEKRWREVFLLVAERMGSADYLLVFMKQQIDDIVAADQLLQQFLVWICEKSASLTTSKEELVRVRSLYFDRDFDRNLLVLVARARERELDRARERELDLDLDLDLDLVLARDFARALSLDLAHVRDFALDLARARARDLARARALELDRALARALPLALARDPKLHQLLQSLKGRLSKLFLSNEKSFKQWWATYGIEWTEQLRTVMIQHRNIGHDWQFSYAQQELLKQYRDANQLLIDCLNSECYVSRDVRQRIESTLFSPVKTIREE